MILKKNFLAGLLSLLLLVCLFKTTYAISYNPTTDFSITNGNPNGVWSYGWMAADLSAFNLYTDSFMNAYNSPHWYSEPATWDYSPDIFRNDDSIPHHNVAPGDLTLHPGINGEASVLRFTAPSGGLYDIDGQFLSGDIRTMLVGVRQGSDWLWQGVDSGVFNFNRSITSGSSIDFLVYGGYYFGNTPLRLIISGEDNPAVPEPGTMLLLGSVLAGIAGTRFKRKKI